MRRGRKPKEAQKAAEVDLAQEIGPAKRTMSFIGAGAAKLMKCIFRPSMR